ncbi:MAG: heme exporter protein CcmB [Actinobacteria bacterium]|nr:heme exporter protein CcmB [Actinomycetota bacterium]
MSLWTQVVEIARVDLVVERRIGDVFRIVLPFAVAALFVFPIALGVELATMRRVGPAVFWTLGILFGMQVALRHSATDTPPRRDMQALAGLDPAARFLGRAISGAVVMTGFLVVVYVAMVALYDSETTSWWVTALAALLFAAGLTTLSTLVGEATTGLRHRTGLASLLIAPLSLPLVLAASQTLAAVSDGTGILPWMLLMTGTDIALLVAGVGLARPLEEAGR